MLWFALRRGPKYGIIAGAIYGVAQFVQDPFAVHPVQVLLDYPIAFGALGLAGFFQRIPLLGVATAIIGRFGSHLLSGVIFFSEYAPTGQSPWLYSALYNGSYLTAELIVSLFVMYVLVRRKMIELYK